MPDWSNISLEHYPPAHCPYFQTHLLIDFLVWRVLALVGGQIEHWVQEHQPQLEVVCDGDQVWLKMAANLEKSHDGGIKVNDLQEIHAEITCRGIKDLHPYGDSKCGRFRCRTSATSSKSETYPSVHD